MESAAALPTLLETHKTVLIRFKLVCTSSGKTLLCTSNFAKRIRSCYIRVADLRGSLRVLSLQ